MSRAALFLLGAAALLLAVAQQYPTTVPLPLVAVSPLTADISLSNRVRASTLVELPSLLAAARQYGSAAPVYEAVELACGNSEKDGCTVSDEVKKSLLTALEEIRHTRPIDAETAYSLALSLKRLDEAGVATVDFRRYFESGAGDPQYGARIAEFIRQREIPATSVAPRSLPLLLQWYSQGAAREQLAEATSDALLLIPKSCPVGDQLLQLADEGPADSIRRELDRRAAECDSEFHRERSLLRLISSVPAMTRGDYRPDVSSLSWWGVLTYICPAGPLSVGAFQNEGATVKLVQVDGAERRAITLFASDDNASWRSITFREVRNSKLARALILKEPLESRFLKVRMSECTPDVSISLYGEDS